MDAQNLLITGRPGIGKTTLIQRLADRIDGGTGFYTAEIRENGTRKGFKLVSLEGGPEVTLAHVDISSSSRVSKYGVDVAGFEAFLDNLDLSCGDPVFIDEIGKMECFSDRFCAQMRQLLDDPDRTVVATVAQRGSGFIAEVRGRADSRLIQITRSNRDDLVAELLSTLR